MPRPRSFDEAQVLQCAMMTFWRLGFDATTYKVLEAESGVGVRSMHNTFGEKDDLFVKSLAAYHAMASGLLDQLFAEPGLESIRTVFAGMVQTRPEDDISQSGCLMVNTVFEIPEKPQAVEDAIGGYRAMWRDHFRAALVADGVADAETRAEFLLGALWGVLSQIRLAGDTTAGKPMADIVIQTVESWR